MHAIFYYLLWERAETPYLKQGVKGNRRPKGALGGGNGSYMVKGQSAKLHLYVKGDDGKIYYSNIYDRVMKETGFKNMTDKRYDKLYEKFKNASFTINDEYIEWNCSLI